MERQKVDMKAFIFKSACPYDCFDACAFNVYAADGKVIKITANQDADYTGNFICKKGIAHQERMYRPDRLQYPLRKTARGFIRTTWDEAYDLIAQKITEARASYGITAVGSYLGDGAAGMLKKEAQTVFMAHLGGYTEFTGSICWGAGIAAVREDFGHVLSHHPEDIANANVIVLWGRNPVETNTHLVPYIKSARENGSRVFLVDPRASESAALADVHIQVLPDGDWAFAAACLAHSLRTNRVSWNFIRNSLYDPTGLIDYLQLLSDEDYRLLLAAAGVTEDIIDDFTSALFDNSPSTCYIGYGLQRYRQGGLTIRCIDLLWAATGNIGVKGGGVNYANQANRGLFDFSFAMPKEKPHVREINLGQLEKELSAADPPVQVLFVSCANPLNQLPDSAKVRRAYGAIPFKVCLEQFMTDTAAASDLVLPVSYFTEEEDIITSGMWNSGIKYAAKCVEPPAECKAELTVFCDLAQRLGLVEYPVFNASQWLKRGMKKLEQYGVTYDQLKKKGWVSSPLQKAVQWENTQFATADGKFHALDKSRLLKRINGVRRNGNQDAESVRLVTVHHGGRLNSQEAVLQQRQELPLLYIHHNTAKKFRVADGDTALAVSGSGRLKVIIKISGRASENVCYMQQGISAALGGPVNVLTHQGVTDIGNQALFNEVHVTIMRTD